MQIRDIVTETVTGLIVGEADLELSVAITRAITKYIGDNDFRAFGNVRTAPHRITAVVWIK